MKGLNLFLSLLTATVLCLSLPIFTDAAEDTREMFKDEPGIEEVQQAAIRYAEVEPEKIACWRRNAVIRTLLPELSLDYDKTIYGSVSSTTGKSVFATGPYDWGFSLKWDLADIIWNPSQTSIDVRSRLMVKLRNEILAEVNRLYFERRRLQIELFREPSPDSDKKLKKELHIAELTAQIDGLTGGYFSWKLEKMREKIIRN
jgi:hypothetical protein